MAVVEAKQQATKDRKEVLRLMGSGHSFSFYRERIKGLQNRLGKCQNQNQLEDNLACVHAMIAYRKLVRDVAPRNLIQSLDRHNEVLQQNATLTQKDKIIKRLKLRRLIQDEITKFMEPADLDLTNLPAELANDIIKDTVVYPLISTVTDYTLGTAKPKKS